ncbi:MAG: tRNA (N(6)-L-threonylcarbamoyladenosine(37)-C(2))-methylthiotransferase MtaB [Anaerolineaceae bacterium]|jgi:threonylcarbamoyladenosine tRNA methylthiotransferase MtaB
MKVYLDTIGCRLNQSEIEKLASQFRAAGHEVVASPSAADLVVVNTCAVTTEAASDSRQKIRQAHKAGQAEIIVTGCWATLEPSAAQSMPAVTRVFSNPLKSKLVSEVLDLPGQGFDHEPLARHPLPGIHQRTRAFIKVQEGCDNFCTFCITSLLRGKSTSTPVKEVLQDIRSALDGGTQEIVLTGVQLGAWGQDFDPPSSLEWLVRKILAETEIPRLRLSSLEPWNLNVPFFSLWENPRLCRHLHLPLQSGCEATLKRMGRNITPAAYASLVSLARQISPKIAITTDMITGFPGETAEEFAESLAFVKEIEFASGHVFHYSARPGTPATRLPGQVPVPLLKERSAEIRKLINVSSLHYQQSFVGKTLSVLWESAKEQPGSGWLLEGHSDNYLRIIASSDRDLWNQISPVLVDEIQEEGCKGRIWTH